ncbi:MAG: hypothetical protein AB7O45_03775 [Alphaproteobacteria bacterium]
MTDTDMAAVTGSGDFVARLRALAERPSQPEAVQRTIAELAEIASIDPSRRRRAGIDAQIEIGIEALTPPAPNVALAALMAEQARLRVFARTSGLFRGFLRDTDGAARAILDRAIVVSFFFFLLTTVLFDVLVALLVWAVARATGGAFDDLAGRIPIFEMYYMLAVFFGYVGGVTSLMFRLSAAQEAGVPVRILFFMQVYKPLLGSAFAGVVYCMLKSGFVLPGVQSLDNTYFYCFIGFLSGFSERFAPDLLSRAEGRYREPTASSTPEARKGADPKEA